MRLQAWTNNVRRILRLLQQFRRNDHVGVDRPERGAKLLGCNLAPALWLAHGIFVAHHKRWVHFIAEAQHTVLGKSAKDESNISPRKRIGNVGNALIEKTVVTQVRIGIKRNRSEENYNWFA